MCKKKFSRNQFGSKDLNAYETQEIGGVKCKRWIYNFANGYGICIFVTIKKENEYSASLLKDGVAVNDEDIAKMLDIKSCIQPNLTKEQAVYVLAKVRSYELPVI